MKLLTPTHSPTRRRTIVLARAAVVAAVLACTVGIGASTALAATCDTSWTNAGGGSWFTSANWDNGVPNSGVNACITLNGTYTVTITGTAAVNSLSLGGSSGTQTLLVQGACGFNAQLAISGASTVGAQGVVTMNDVNCGYAQLYTPNGSTLTSGGTINYQPGNGTPRYLDVNLTNNGTLNLNASIVPNGSGLTLSNNGTVNVANGVTFTWNGNALANNPTGSVATVGTGQVVLNSATLTQAGTNSGNPLRLRNGTLNHTTTASSHVQLFGAITFTGNVMAGQTLDLVGACGFNTQLSMSANVANGGTINLDDQTCGYAQLYTPNGSTLTNTGTINYQPGNGTPRYLDVNLTNNGTLNLNASIVPNGSGLTLSNNSAVNVANGVTFTWNGNTVANNSTGAIATTGTGQLVLNSSTLSQAGTNSGNPIVMRNGTLNHTATAPSHVRAFGAITFTGNVVAGQTLDLVGACGFNTQLSMSANVANGGTINLDDQSCGYAQLYTPNGSTLTNTGTINYQPGNGTPRYLDVNLTNNGTLNVNASILPNASGLTLTNNGTIGVAAGKSFSWGSNTILNNAGSISIGTGQVMLSSGSFTQKSGVVTGQPVFMRHGSLNFTGKAAAAFELRGTVQLVNAPLVGTQVVTATGECGNNVRLFSNTDQTNKGKIYLNDVGCGYSMLDYTGHTLTNSGTIQYNAGTGTPRYFRGNIINAKTIVIDKDVIVHHDSQGAFTQTSKGSLTSNVLDATHYGSWRDATAATVDGTMKAKKLKGYVLGAGNTLTVLTAGSVTGTFAKTSGLTAKAGVYLLPTMNANSVTLVARQATISILPPSGPAGSPVTVSGTAYPPNRTVTISFKDHARVTTVIGTASTDVNGNWSTGVSIPSGAALGTGSLSAKSSFIAVNLKATFTVV